MTRNTTSTFSLPDRDGLEARFGVRVASMLGERAQSTAPDISERLRFAREQALSRAQAARRQVQAATAPVVVSRGRSAALASPLGWWFKLGSAAPLALLVLGLAEHRPRARQGADRRRGRGGRRPAVGRPAAGRVYGSGLRGVPQDHPRVRDESWRVPGIPA